MSHKRQLPTVSEPAFTHTNVIKKVAVCGTAVPSSETTLSGRSIHLCVQQSGVQSQYYSNTMKLIDKPNGHAAAFFQAGQLMIK